MSSAKNKGSAAGRRLKNDRAGDWSMNLHYKHSSDSHQVTHRLDLSEGCFTITQTKPATAAVAAVHPGLMASAGDKMDALIVASRAAACYH